MCPKLALLASLVFMIPALLPAVSGLELSYYGINAEIESSMVVNFEVTMIPDGPLNSMIYNLDFGISNLTVESSSGASRCSFENVGLGSRIECDFYGMEEGKGSTIKMMFTTKDAVKRQGDQYEFRASFPVTMPVAKMFSTLRLPPQSTLAGDIANESFFPPTGRVITDGKHMMVSWQREGLSQNDNLSFSVLFDVIGAGGTMWDLLILSMVLIVVIAMAGIAVYVRRGSPAQKGEVKVLPLLNKDEKRIVDIVAKKGGSARQRDVVKEADFSKAKVSRLIKSLKERGVVDTEAISGRENKVILKIKGVEPG
ncbi:MAG: hypothetical protein V1813_03875 [Candidatus Aenigmatarchaeota archaeon]